MFRLRNILLIFSGVIFLLSCSKDEDYKEITPVVMDLSQVPYQKLSEYKFFKGDIKNLIPAYGVLPYQPISGLYTDYAEKLRLIWMPTGLKASYIADNQILNFPVGTALIKNFYYSDTAPSHQKKVIETRIMILKENGWIYADYVWNDDQTDAFLQTISSVKNFSFYKSNGELLTVDYKIPSNLECTYCHKISNINQPIGVKPQNINFNYNYSNGSKNQLDKLIAFGYLDNNLPTEINTLVDYEDTSKSLNLRVRSYFDANCAHCHIDGGYADDFDIRLSFTDTESMANLGVCKNAIHFVPGFSGEIVIPQNPLQSILYYKMSTTNPNFQMPFIGRSIPHQEGLSLVEEWINSLEPCN